MFKEEAYWVLLLLSILSSLLLFLASDYFSVDTILFQEIRYFLKEDLLEGVELPYGANIFKVHRASLSQHLLENPLIKRVQIRRRLPGTLMVTITEQRPLVYVYKEDQLFLVGCLGVVMRQESLPGEFSLPEVYVKEEVLLGERAPLSVMEYIPLLGDLSLSLLSQVEKISLSVEKMVLQLYGEGQIFIPRTFTSTEAYQLHLILQDVGDERPLEYIDMRYKSNPVIKFKK